MAETAKILNRHKLVILPDLAVGCSLAYSCPLQEFAAFKAAHPDHLVISCINCTAEIKAIREQTGRDLLLWQGSCIVHETFSEKKLVQLKIAHPEAEVIAHPECETSVLRHANYIGSTTALLNYCKKSPASTFIVATEPGIIHQMQKEAPNKLFIPAPPAANCACNECPYMRLNTLEKLYWAMKNRTPEIRNLTKISYVTFVSPPVWTR